MIQPLRHLTLSRPLVVLDLESTGPCPSTDRIVEVGLIRLSPGARPLRFRRYVDPEMAIPSSSTAVHGITDDHVAGSPRFATLAPRLCRLLEGADLAGFGIARFDLPLLAAEFRRAEVEYTISGRRVIDALRIYHDRERRDLTSAVSFYCETEHDGAHTALADAEASLAVLDAQVGRYGLPADPEELAALTAGLDVAGRLRLEDGVAVFGFGRHRGVALSEVASDDPGYLRWFLNQDFLDDAKALVREALDAAEEG